MNWASFTRHMISNMNRFAVRYIPLLAGMKRIGSVGIPFHILWHMCSCTRTSTNLMSLGHAIAQAASRWLPTAAARVRARVWQVGLVVDKMAMGQVFSEYFGFPCQPHFIPPTSPSSQSSGTSTIGQYMAAVPRGHPIWTPPPTIQN
jgi:hypothetical protein